MKKFSFDKPFRTREGYDAKVVKKITWPSICPYLILYKLPTGIFSDWVTDEGKRFLTKDSPLDLVNYVEEKKMSKDSDKILDMNKPLETRSGLEVELLYTYPPESNTCRYAVVCKDENGKHEVYSIYPNGRRLINLKSTFDVRNKDKTRNFFNLYADTCIKNGYSMSYPTLDLAKQGAMDSAYGALEATFDLDGNMVDIIAFHKY